MHNALPLISHNDQ